jgi:hypothetical protein
MQFVSQKGACCCLHLTIILSLDCLSVDSFLCWNQLFSTLDKIVYQKPIWKEGQYLLFDLLCPLSYIVDNLAVKKLTN